MSAESAILYSVDLGEIIYEKNPHERMPIASTTKIMTALTVLESKALDEVVTIPQEACGIEGSSAYLTAGEKLTIKELLQALMLQSANDAAVALALATDDNIELFANRMNQIANDLHLKNTNFANPHGLDNDNHYSCAYDLAIITAKALESPVFQELASCKRATIPGKDGSMRFLSNHNKLLNMVEGAIGVKTGYTKKSGRCLVGAAEKNGITLITVTLNAPNDWNDHKNMLSMGFSLLNNTKIVEKGELQFAVDVLGGQSNQVILANNDEIYGITKSSIPDIKIKAEWNRPIYAPIKKGEVLGTIYLIHGNHIIAEAPLVAQENNKVMDKGKYYYGRKN